MTLLLRASRLRHLQLLPAAALLFAAHTMVAQAPAAAKTPSVTPDRASAYYHYGLAHLYEDMAVNAGRSDYATQAVEQYKLALDADPDSHFLQDGLADLLRHFSQARQCGDPGVGDFQIVELHGGIRVAIQTAFGTRVPFGDKPESTTSALHFRLVRRQ